MPPVGVVSAQEEDEGVVSRGRQEAEGASWVGSSTHVLATVDRVMTAWLPLCHAVPGRSLISWCLTSKSSSKTAVRLAPPAASQWLPAWAANCDTPGSPFEASTLTPDGTANQFDYGDERRPTEDSQRDK